MPEDILIYPFNNKPRILCTNRILWCALRDGMMLFRSEFGGLYWSAEPRSLEDAMIAKPADFWIERLDGSIDIRRARAAAPSDYFMLRKG